MLVVPTSFNDFYHPRPSPWLEHPLLEKRRGV
jgi:hypothetical protein